MGTWLPHHILLPPSLDVLNIESNKTSSFANVSVKILQTCNNVETNQQGPEMSTMQRFDLVLTEFNYEYFF